MLTPPLVMAAISAGLLGGLHCIGMCGGIAGMLTATGRKTIPIQPVKNSAQSRPAWRIPVLLHGGRIFTYTIMGAIAGSLGAWGMRIHPFIPVHTLFYIIGNLALIWLGLRLFGYSPSLPAFDRLITKAISMINLQGKISLPQQTRQYPFLVGMAWGCLPCGLVYGVLPFALLSGTALSGAILLLFFGLSALPHLLFAQVIANWAHSSRLPAFLRYAGAGLLTGIGLLGLWWSFNMQEMPAFLCVTATK